MVGTSSHAVAGRALIAQKTESRPAPPPPPTIASPRGLPSVKHGLGILSDQSKFLEMEQGKLDRSNDDDDDTQTEETPDVDAVNQASEARSSGAHEEVNQAQPSQSQAPQVQSQRQQPDVSPSVGADEPAPWQNADVRSEPVDQAKDIINKKSSKNKAAAKKAKADKKKSKSKKSKGKPIETAVDDRKEVSDSAKNDHPPVAAQRTSAEEAILVQLVRELEYGTLINSINILNQLVSKYPEDPDYRSLLAMAIRLRHGDVWYQYQRKVDIKEEAEPKIPPANIIKPTANESVNELKKSSWFLIRSVKP